MSLEQIVAKARAFQVKMRRRRWLEFASLPFVVAVYVYASTFPGWVVKLGSLLSALAVANIVWQRHRRDVARRIPEALAAALADFHRAELVRHRDVVSRSMLREALPALSGAILIILGRLIQVSVAGTSLPLVYTICASGAVVVFLVFIILALDRRLQGYRLQLQIDELDRLHGAGLVPR